MMSQAFEAGCLAAMSGCYRILLAPRSPQEEQEWLRGYDAVAIKDRGSIKEEKQEKDNQNFKQLRFSS